ncbi:MAG: hypothetical protein ACYC6Y_07900 [Thermoguttaceae bacterium]
MAVDLQLPTRPKLEPARPAPRIIGQSRPEEPAVPVYRYFLSGGRDQYRLTCSSVAGLTAVGLLVVPWARGLVGIWDAPLIAAGVGASAAAVSLSLAALVAHWTGRRSGLAAGHLAIGGWWVVSYCAPADQMFASAAVVVAIVVFAWAELLHPKATKPAVVAGPAFYAAAVLAWVFSGPILLAPIAAVSLATLLGTENSRGIRFFFSRSGLCVLVAGVVLNSILRGAVGVPGSPPWLPSVGGHAPSCLVAAGVIGGAIVAWISARSGHGASGLGRLLTGWLLAPSMLAVSGVVPAATALAIATPAWAAVAAIGFHPTAMHLKKRFRRVALLGR